MRSQLSHTFGQQLITTLYDPPTITQILFSRFNVDCDALWILFSRFNVDCDASAGLYSAAEGAFGTDGAGADGDIGECPAPGNKSPEECAGSVSNCWSPGQRDTGGR